MADVVQYRLERMVDEFDDLERRGLFTRTEIAEIVKKRRTFEYRLKRPCPLKQDYLAYIDYEVQLDTLRGLRKKSIVREMKKTNHKKRWKKSLSDYAGVRRVLEIYRLAVMRYKGDLDLWFRYLEFCRQRRHGRMKQALAQAVRFHPKVPGLWIYAAAWEFDQNLDVAAARALMQHGLRVCRDSEDLWVEYLRMELTYLNKLKARRIALGEDSGKVADKNNDEDEKKWRDENGDSFIPLNDKKDDTDGSDSGGKTDEKVEALREQGFNIFRTIYKEAVDAIPLSMNLMKRFLEILEEMDLANSLQLKEEIMNDMKRYFSGNEEFWDWLGRLVLVDGRKKEATNTKAVDLFSKVVQVYEEAVSHLPTAKMFSLYSSFLLDIIFTANEDSQHSSFTHSLGDSVDLTSHLLKVYEKAESSRCLTEDLAHQYISFILQLGRVEDARTVAEKICAGKLSGIAKLWVLRVSIEMKRLARHSVSKDDLKSVFELLKSALSKFAISEAESLWLMAIKFFCTRKEYFDKLVQMFLMSLAHSGDSSGGFSVSSAFVNWVLSKDGIRQAREMYKRFLSAPHPSLALYRQCMELESSLAFAGCTDGLLNARKLFESALTSYNQDVRLWHDYYSMEIKVGTPETASSVYWRARKVLKDKAGLVAEKSL
ncbi:hypothetical protein H6P81_014744 [Aristolochia fimbriata]|uniref:U3 small nucleolar RNA-associated protein 6 n=1 Tax=Aristolochia fimbriata TaxID=158543 RepID=A0AAV7E3L1_ARIFI|nr:hypothetical protein H6P81_014744 [Aristolochia fimbriata]